MGQAQLTLRVSRDVIKARELMRKMAQEAGFGLANQTRLATAISEIARNAIVHGGGGEMSVDLAQGKKTITVVISDQGPGIADIEQAMTDGWSSTGSQGMGLPGAQRIVSSFHVESSPGQGAAVTLKMTE